MKGFIERGERDKKVQRVNDDVRWAKNMRKYAVVAALLQPDTFRFIKMILKDGRKLRE